MNNLLIEAKIYKELLQIEASTLRQIVVRSQDKLEFINKRKDENPKEALGEAIKFIEQIQSTSIQYINNGSKGFYSKEDINMIRMLEYLKNNKQGLHEKPTY